VVLISAISFVLKIMFDLMAIVQEGIVDRRKIWLTWIRNALLGASFRRVTA
jgi:hypothetical protein